MWRSASDLLKDRRQKLMLLLLNPCVEHFSRIAREYWHLSLRDDRTGIDAAIDIVNRASSDLFARVERLFPRAQTRKLREQ